MTRNILILMLVIGGIALVGITAYHTSQNPETNSWKTVTSASSSWKYPDMPQGEYVDVRDWPPTFHMFPAEYSCNEAGNGSERAGETKKVTVQNREYCRTIVIGAAAGSVYKQYAYAFRQEDGIGVFTFSTRFVQCVNYDEPKAKECQIEQSTFNPDILIDQVAQTLTFQK